MFLPLKNFGRYGVIADTQSEALPPGAWTDARNVRFSGPELEKMREPIEESNFSKISDFVAEGDYPRWMQGWADSVATYVVVAFGTSLWFWKEGQGGGEWIDASRAGAAYDAEGQWQSFGWGDTVIFNNGRDKPQIFDPSAMRFYDLPRWGLVSSASDISGGTDPSVDLNPRCRMLLPYKNFLVACGVTENGQYQPNKVWWSDATTLASYRSATPGGGPPSWDFESPATLSGQTEVGIGDGRIVTAKVLNENVIVYTESSATALQNSGGTLVMTTRRLFNKGAAGLHTAAEFNNQHFVVARDQIYVHDGSSVHLIAKDRIEDEFFKRIGKGGRFGDGEVNFESIQVVKNPDRKEIIVVFDEEGK